MQLSELGSPRWATNELKEAFITVYRARLSKEDKQFINDKYGYIVSILLFVSIHLYR